MMKRVCTRVVNISSRSALSALIRRAITFVYTPRVLKKSAQQLHVCAVKTRPIAPHIEPGGQRMAHEIYISQRAGAPRVFLLN